MIRGARALITKYSCDDQIMMHVRTKLKESTFNRLKSNGIFHKATYIKVRMVNCIY